jgi:pimeloyl-ACP methyl ester carboxylesterase
LRKIGKRAATTLLVVIGLLIAVVCVFDQQRRSRETQIAAAVAPHSGRFVQSGDVKIFVQESGPANAPAVMLIHGTGTWSEIWRETIDALSADHHVIAVDLPPFGYSDKPLGDLAYTRQMQASRLIQLIEMLHLRNVTLVGHSVGARPVVEAALRSPALISRLVLIDPALGFQANRDAAPHFEQNNPSWPARTLFGIPSLRNAVISAYGTNTLFTARLFRSFVSNKAAVTPQRVEIIQRPMQVRETTAAYGAWLRFLVIAEDQSLSSNFANLRRLSMPVGIIWGRTDTVTPLWQGERLRELIPHTRLIVIDGVGHIPYIEDPPHFIAALRTLLSSS